jgi:hypothetical protein
MPIMVENLGRVRKSYGSYTSVTAILFSIATKKDDKRYRAIDWGSCRDYINDALIANINGRHTYGGTMKIGYDIDFKKLRLLVDYRDKNKKDAVFAAKRMIDAYEKIAGFKEKLVISSVLDGQFPKLKPTVCLLTGSEEWLKCSQLVSLITLVTRIFHKISDNIPKDISFSNIKEINEFWERTIQTNKAIHDISNYASNYKRWGILMENFAEIFDGLKTEDLYPKYSMGNWHSCGGIVSLGDMRTQIKELDSRLKKFFE